MRITLLQMAISLTACIALGPGAARAEISDADKAFLDAMAASDLAEVELSRVSASHTLSPQVRAFAQTVGSDHDENYQALLDLCRDKKYAVAPRMDPAHAGVVLKLRNADSPQAAERVYLDAIGTDQAAIDSLLEKTSGNSNDADIGHFAADTLVVVKNHEASARQLARQ